MNKTIFQEAWWLDITAPKRWGVISHDVKSGKVFMTYAFRKRFKFFTDIYPPALTPYTGLYFEMKGEISRAEKYKILNESIPLLISKLPKYTRFKVNFTTSFDWWSPFYWLGFGQHVRYTSILNGIKNHDEIWKGFNTNTKRNIKKANKTITVKKSYDAATLYSLFEKTMINQGRRPGWSQVLLENICKEIEKRQRGMVLTGEDQEGVPHCSLLLVWDDSVAYYLAGGTDPKIRSSGAMPLTMWTAIQEASNHVDTFDFEGSMQKGIDNFFRGFGAIPKPYYNISDGIMANKIVRQKK